MNESVKSADRTLDLLEFFVYQETAVALRDISTALAIPKSSALMLLRTLTARGYLSRIDGELYCLNPALRGSDGSWIGGLHGILAASAHPVMVSLVDETKETVLLATFTKARMTRILAKILSPLDPRFDLDSKVARPAYCTALGRVFLAHLSQPEIDAYFAATEIRRLTSTTETDPDRLRSILADVRELGFAEIDQEYVVGGSGVAAPIFGPDGNLIAALNLAAVSPRYAMNRTQLIVSVKVAAAEISATIAKRLGSHRAADSYGTRQRDHKAGPSPSPVRV